MNGLFKGLIAGYGASKLGGGCLGTVLVFALIWWLLGTCDNDQHAYRQKESTRTTIAICRQW